MNTARVSPGIPVGVLPGICSGVTPGSSQGVPPEYFVRFSSGIYPKRSTYMGFLMEVLLNFLQ